MTRSRMLLAGLIAAAGAILLPAAATAGGGCHPGTGKVSQKRAASGDSFTAAIADCAFRPVVLYVDAGTEVTWLNDDMFPHTVTGALLAWGSDRTLATGDQISQRFDRQGVFPYYCAFHPGMVGAVVVGDPDPADVPVGASVLGAPAAPAAPAAEEVPPARAPVVEPASDAVPAGVLGLIGLALAGGAAGAWSLRRRGRAVHGV